MEPEHQHQERGTSYHDIHGQHWIEGGSPFHSHHQSPANEYNGFSFTGLPMDPMYTATANSMQPPQTRATQQQLQPLILPPWPSLLTSQSSYPTPVYQSSPASATTPIKTPISAPPTTGRPERPRRTLTDNDRRKMCEYAEANPKVKQTEIGAMFGVERSTVSKVLRNKEKYLSQDDPNKSQKNKGRFPDMERTLSNWVKKLDQPVTDAMLKDKIMQFAASVELADDDIKQKVNNSSWLEKFKIKHGLLSKSRKNSYVDDSERTATSSNVESGAQTPNLSPSSPSNKRDHSPSRLSIALEMGKERKKLKSESPDSFTNVEHNHIAAHRPFASISSAFTSVPNTTFSAGPISPTTSPFFDANPFNPQQSVQPIAHNMQYQPRPRSQTFPMTAPVDSISYMASTSAEVSKFLPAGANDSPVDHLSVSIPSGTFEPGLLSSSPEDTVTKLETSGAVQSVTSIPTNMSLAHQSGTPTGNLVAVPQPPSSPSLDETRRALEVVWTFLHQQQALEPDEYVVMNKLMEKLKLHHHQHHAVTRGPELQLPGGMHRLDEMTYAATVGRTIAD